MKRVVIPICMFFGFVALAQSARTAMKVAEYSVTMSADGTINAAFSNGPSGRVVKQECFLSNRHCRATLDTQFGTWSADLSFNAEQGSCEVAFYQPEGTKKSRYALNALDVVTRPHHSCEGTVVARYLGVSH